MIRFIPNSARSKTALTLVSSLLLVGIVSCDRKVSQCNQFADVINQSQSFKAEFESEIQSAMAQASSAQNLEDLQAFAGEYTAAVEKVTDEIGGMEQDLTGLSIDDEQLDEYRDSYVTIITSSREALTTAGNAMQTVAAVKTEDEFRKIFDAFQTQTDSAFSDLQSLSAEESALITQVNDYCGAQPE